jgi:hypothetical protein
MQVKSPIAVYWDELAGRASHSEGGEGRKRDREAYEADFDQLISFKAAQGA